VLKSIPRLALLFSLSIAAASLCQAGSAKKPILPDSPGHGGSTNPATQAKYLAVVGGTLIDGTGAEPIPDAVIIIEGDMVRAAGPRREIRIPPGSYPLDATGFTVVPGLVDMHVHAVPDLPMERFLQYGITSVRHMGDTTLEWITDLKDKVDSGDLAGPRIFHCGLFVVSRPPLDPNGYPPDLLTHFAIMDSPDDADDIVAGLTSAGADLIKVKTEMSIESLHALVKAADSANLIVSFDNGGRTDYYDAGSALDAGALGVEHLNGINHSEPLEVESVMLKMLRKKAFAVPTLGVLQRTISARRVIRRQEFTREFLRRGGLVVAGTDTPAHGLAPGSSLHDELKLLVAAGLTAQQALGAATGGAGRALGRQGEIGTLEAGSFADFLLVKGDPFADISHLGRIELVYKGGRQVHPPAQTASSPVQSSKPAH
jgi:imidazolonepropionase-like amidohydrolase